MSNMLIDLFNYEINLLRESFGFETYNEKPVVEKQSGFRWRTINKERDAK